MGDNLIGRILNKRYEIRELLDQGKTAFVFVAHDRSPLDRRVALKVIKAEYAMPPDAVEASIKEVRRIANLDHPNILRIYDLGTETVDNVQRFYLVMRFARGGTLAERLEAGTLSLNETKHILKGICAALEYARSQEVLHLDLTPDNILFDEQGHVMVADFGLTKLIQETTHFEAGTDTAVQDYVSPEQLSGSQTGSFSDVYALGIILHQMLTGELPKRRLMGADPAVRPSKSLPCAIQPVIETATRSNPRQRYRTAGELAEAFTVAIAPSASAPRERYTEVGKGERDLPLLKETEEALQAAERAEAQTPAEDRTGKRRSPVGWLQTVIKVAGLIVPLISCVAAAIVVPELRQMLGLESLTISSVPTAASQTATSAATPTPIPSATPTALPFPTATPISCLTVTDEQLNVYTGPEEFYDVLGQAHEGDRLSILGRSEDGRWLQVDYLGWSGWVATQSVLADVDPLAFPTVETPPPPVNRPPVVQEIGIVSTTIETWAPISVTCKASDLDDDELTYTWEASDGFITGEGEAVTYNAPEITGSQTITLTVQDEDGRKTKHSIQVQIVPAQPPPGTFEPFGIFGQIWYEHSETHRKLGWATGEDRTTPGAQQSFERGVMFWRKDTDDIYVLTQDGNWQMYIDTWEEGMDEYSCPDVAQRQTPPTPMRGFGKVWCEQLGGPNAEIGWATNYEQGYSAHWQTFEHGFMCQGHDGCIYVFYEDDSWQSYPSSTNEGSSSCPSAPSQRIRVGDRARVCTAYHRLALRAQPQRDGSEITRLEPGTYVTVVDGPAYANGWSWWKVRIDSGTVGWVAEGGDDIDPCFICPER
jgi:serine/threonine protein kinase